MRDELSGESAGATEGSTERAEYGDEPEAAGSAAGGGLREPKGGARGGLRAWILLLALVSFLAGVAGGVLLSLEAWPRSAEPRPFANYETMLVKAFELEPERQKVLQLLLDRYQREIEDVQSRHMPEMEPELVKLGLTYRDWIRDTVLRPESREHFDQLVASRAAPSTTP